MALSLTRRTDYALVTLAALAAAAQNPAGPLSARSIAEAYRLPHPLLMQILKELTRAGIVKSHRGVKGGYSLCRAPREVTLLEVVEAIEGPVRLMVCSLHGEVRPPRGRTVPCPSYPLCPIKQPVRRLDRRLRQLLAEFNLEELLGGAAPLPGLMPEAKGGGHG